MHMCDRRKNLPSLRIAMIRTINGGKSNFHIRANSIKPTCCKQAVEKNKLCMQILQCDHPNNKYKMPLNKGKGLEGTGRDNIPRYEL